MHLNKLIIEGQMAHFKKPFLGKIQQTNLIPNLSTVIGILKNIYGKDINNFVFGYIFTADEQLFRDVQTIYKEVNLDIKTNKDAKRFVSDVCEIQYLVNPKLIIYSNIEMKPSISSPLILGKTDCLAKLKTPIEKVELRNEFGYGYNQWTDLEVGDGVIERTTIETLYKVEKGYYDIYGGLLRKNEIFEYDKYFDEEENQNIFLWKYEGIGEVNAYKEADSFKS